MMCSWAYLCDHPSKWNGFNNYFLIYSKFHIHDLGFWIKVRVLLSTEYCIIRKYLIMIKEKGFFHPFMIGHLRFINKTNK